MQNHLTSHMRNFIDGKVSVESLSIATQAEKVDRERANRVWMLLTQWENGGCTMHELRERTRSLI